jgi:hypothetical protein
MPWWHFSLLYHRPNPLLSNSRTLPLSTHSCRHSKLFKLWQKWPRCLKWCCCHAWPAQDSRLCVKTWPPYQNSTTQDFKSFTSRFEILVVHPQCYSLKSPSQVIFIMSWWRTSVFQVIVLQKLCQHFYLRPICTCPLPHADSGPQDFPYLKSFSQSLFPTGLPRLRVQWGSKVSVVVCVTLFSSAMNIISLHLCLSMVLGKGSKGK